MADAEISFRKAIQIDGQSAAAHLGLAKALLGGPKGEELFRSLQQAVTLEAGNQEARHLLTEFALAAYLQSERRPVRFYETLNKLAAEALAADPKSFDGWRIRGLLARTDGKNNEAIAAFRQALTTRPGEPEMTRSLAYLLAETEGGQNEAESLLRGLIRAQPSLAATYDDLATQLLKASRPDEAELVLRQKIEALPGNAAAVAQLADFYRQRGQAQMAEARIQTLLASPKTNPSAPLEAGNYYARQGQWAEALAAYQKGWAVDSTLKPTYGKRMVAALNALGRLEEARNIVEQSLALAPRDLDLRTARALLELARRAVGEAETQLDALVKENPDSASLHFHHGRALALAGKGAEAIAAWREAARRAPGFLDPLLAIATASLDGSRFNDALVAADAALSVAAGNPQALLTRVAALEGLGRNQEARTLLQSLRREHPQSAGLDVEQGYLELREAKFASAEALFRKRYQPGSENLRVISGLARSLGAQGRLDEALRLLESELRLSPARAELRYMRAETRLALGQQAEGFAELERIANEQPAFPLAGMRVAELEARRGNSAAAIARLRRLRNSAPKEPEITALLAQLLEGAGQQNEAKALYREVLRTSPKHLVAQNGLANLIAESGTDAELSEAFGLALAARAAAPKNPTIADTLGLLYLRRQQREAALPLFREAVALAPENPQFKAHLERAQGPKGQF